MGWIQTNPRGHACSHPVVTFNKGDGSMWQCDECKQVWVIKRWGGPNEDRYAEWKKVQGQPTLLAEESAQRLVLERLGLK